MISSFFIYNIQLKVNTVIIQNSESESESLSKDTVRLANSVSFRSVSVVITELKLEFKRFWDKFTNLEIAHNFCYENQ